MPGQPLSPFDAYQNGCDVLLLGMTGLTRQAIKSCRAPVHEVLSCPLRYYSAGAA
jgi:hypothetical protein